VFSGSSVPVLLLPRDIFERLTPTQLQAVIAHELCHIRYRDNLTAGIHMFVETVFWFHPMVWWIGKQMVAERERACDEEVLSLGSDPRVYAQGILDVCKLYLAAPMPCVSAVSGSDLKKRIEAILKNRAAARLSFTRKALLAGAAIAAVAAPLAMGILNAPFARAQSQTNSALQFEVASLKPARPSPDGRSSPKCKGGPGTSDPGLFTCVDQTFGNLLAEAFDLAFYQLPNAYGDRSQYEIDAKVPPGATRAQFRSMFQNLVIERFRLKYHFEKKEMPVYDLVVAKGGLKMKEAAPDPPSDPGAPRPPNRSRLDLRAGKWTAYGVPVGLIMSIVLGEVQAPVTDATGLQGKYDFTLTWAGRAAPANDDSEPTLLEAIERQLGIKVERKKGEVDVLLIDHAEKTPIAN
jgi:bla regulator protein BlaR1